MSTGSSGALAARLWLDTSGFQASMQAAGQVSEKEMARIRRQVQFVSDYVKELGNEQRRVNEGASMAKATTEMVKFGQAAELSSKQTANAMRQMPAQITDIVTSLAAGQQPWMVLLQQGGQIKDSFGGISNAVRQLAASVGVAGLAVGGIVAAVGIVALGLTRGQAEFNAYRLQLLNTGGAASATADQLNGMAAAIDATSAATRGKAAGVIATLTSEGGVSRAQMLQVTQATIAAERSLGIEAEKTAKAFSDLGRDPLTAAVKLNEKFNFLTETTYRQIKALVDQKREAEAAAVAQEAYASATIQRAVEMEGNLGSLELAWRGIGDAAKWAWDQMLNIGRQESLDEKLKRVLGAQKDAAKSGWWDLRSKSQREGQMADLRDSEDLIREQMRMAQRAADARARQAASVRAMAEADRKRTAPARMPNDALHNEYAAYGQDRMESDDATREAAQKRAEQDAKDQWEIEKRNAVQMFRDDSERMTKEAAEAKKTMEELARDGANHVKVFEDSILSLVKNGKDGFRNLFVSMAEEYLRNLARMAAQKFLLDKNGAFVGWATGMGNMASGIGAMFGGNSHAGGLEYVPYDGYPAVLHKGEKVQTAVEASAGRRAGGGMSFDFSGQTLNVGQGVSRAEVDATVARRNAELEMRMRRLSREGVFGS